jgi:hypothetical protein
MMVSQVTLDRTARPRAFHTDTSYYNLLFVVASRGVSLWQKLYPVVHGAVPYIFGFRFEAFNKCSKFLYI